MDKNKKTGHVLEDVKVNVKVKISALWVVLMLIYIYVDIFSFFRPGIITDILAGMVWKFEINQAWALGSLLLMMVPALMVFLSLVLKPGANRLTNIIVSILYIVVGVGTTVGETWAYYIVGHITGIVLLILILIYSLRWPKQDASQSG